MLLLLLLFLGGMLRQEAGRRQATDGRAALLPQQLEAAARDQADRLVAAAQQDAGDAATRYADTHTERSPPAGPEATSKP